MYNYTIDERYIYYQVEGEKPIYRIDMQKYNGGASLKESRITIANHPIRFKNIICRMMVNNDTLYYINDKDHCLYSIPCHESDTSYAAMGGSLTPMRVSNIPMHYFILTAYKGEMIAIFTKYASSNDELNKARLGAIYMSNGEPVKELSFLEQIRSRYINTMGGYLYYCDSADDKNLYRVELKETSSPRFEEIKSGMSLGYPLCFSDWVFADCVDENGVFYAYNISTNTGKVFRIRSDY